MIHKEIQVKNLRYSGIMWYFSPPYWFWTYCTLSKLSQISFVRVVYGKKSQYRVDINCILGNTFIMMDVI